MELQDTPLIEWFSDINPAGFFTHKLVHMYIHGSAKYSVVCTSEENVNSNIWKAIYYKIGTEWVYL